MDSQWRVEQDADKAEELEATRRMLHEVQRESRRLRVAAEAAFAYVMGWQPPGNPNQLSDRELLLRALRLIGLKSESSPRMPPSLLRHQVEDLEDA